jgi:hypothetical protein
MRTFSWNAARAAVAAGTLAGLAVLGACADGVTSKSVTEPNIKIRDEGSGTFANSGVVRLCVSAASPAGTYHFTNSFTGAGGGGTTIFNTADAPPTSAPYDIVKPGAAEVCAGPVPLERTFALNPLNDPLSVIEIEPSGNSVGATFAGVVCADPGGGVPAPSPCAETTFAFANWNHGTKLTYSFAVLGTCPLGSITAGFNGTAIPAGRTIWFTANLKPKGPIVDGTTISFTFSSIDLNGTIIPGPDGQVTYSAAATDATTAFVAGVWQTTVPLSYKKDVFLAGTQYTTPVNLPGGVKPVTWTGAFSSNTAGVTAQWQFAAAVYQPFGAYPALGIKPIGDNTLLYPNHDTQGTPENFKANIKSGAMGGGGSNFTGSWSSTKAVCVD